MWNFPILAIPLWMKVMGKEVTRAGKGQKGGFVLSPLRYKAITGMGITRTGMQYNNMDQMDIIF